MKRLFVLSIGLLAFAGSAFAQTSTMDADTVALAAPANLRAGATIIRWHADHAAYDTLKQGNNKLVCYDRSGFPEQQAFSIECTTQSNIERVKQNLKIEAGGDKNKSNQMVAAAEKDGSRVKPEYGSVFYHLMGADKDHAHTHMTICVPGATSKSLPFPETAASGVVWIMDAGTSGAHLMTPGE